MNFQLKVDGFVNGGMIPRQFTCDGTNLSPAVSWSGVPLAARSLALVVEDPDAPTGAWFHWLLWDLPAAAAPLPSAYRPVAPVRTGTNDFGTKRYSGPCPPPGHGPHRYFFRLFALDTESIHLPAGASRDDLMAQVERHTIASADYMGRYSR